MDDLSSTFWRKYKCLVVIILVVFIVGIGGVIFGVLNNSGKNSASIFYFSEWFERDDGVDYSSNVVRIEALPDFIPTVRSYGGAGFDEFQAETMKDMGLKYVAGIVDFSWYNVEAEEGIWTWENTDKAIDLLARNDIKVIPMIIVPKNGMDWISREDSNFAEKYGEYAYQVVNRYKDHAAWSGLVVVWGGSADVYDAEACMTYPEYVVANLNSAYDGVKRADSSAIVIGFNMATTAFSKAEWEEYFEKSFALHPKFDWFGIQTHGVFPNVQEVEVPNDKAFPTGEDCIARGLEPLTRRTSTYADIPDTYSGLQGIRSVRALLNKYGYSDKPIWQNEGGFLYNPSQPVTHAESIVETYILARILDVDLKGWVYFGYFGKAAKDGRIDEEALSGLMTDARGAGADANGNPTPRLAWYALKNLIANVKFYDYDYESTQQGEVNQPMSYVIKFKGKENASDKLWVVFSPKIGKVDHVEECVTINIYPATKVTAVSMLGMKTNVIEADASGNIVVRSGHSPVYITNSVVSTLEIPSDAMIISGGEGQEGGKESEKNLSIESKESFLVEEESFLGTCDETLVKEVMTSKDAVMIKELGTTKEFKVTEDSGVTKDSKTKDLSTKGFYLDKFGNRIEVEK